MFSLSVSVLSYQRKAEIGDSCGTIRQLPFISLLKSTASNLYFLLYRSSRLCCGSNGFPGYYGMYGFTWSISVRVRLLYLFILFLRDFMSLSRQHHIAYFPNLPTCVIPSLVSGPAKFNLGLFSSKVPFLLVPRSPLSLRKTSRKGPWEGGCFSSWKLMEMQIVNQAIWAHACFYKQNTLRCPSRKSSYKSNLFLSHPMPF